MSLDKVIDLLKDGHYKPIEIERVINAVTRNETGVPTGDPKLKTAHNEADDNQASNNVTH